MFVTYENINLAKYNYKDMCMKNCYNLIFSTCISHYYPWLLHALFFIQLVLFQSHKVSRLI